MDENRILFVDLDGTLIRKTYQILHSYIFKTKSFKINFLFVTFLIKGKPYLKEKISKNFNVPITNLLLIKML